MIGFVFGEFIGLTGGFGEAVAFAAGEDVVEAGFEADAVTKGDDHRFDVETGAQRGSNGFIFVDQGYPRAKFFAERFFVVVASQD
jgi:hypothetical protein